MSENGGGYKLKMVEWTSTASQHIKSNSESSTSAPTYFRSPKRHVAGRRFHNHEKVQTSTRDWLPQEAYNSYRGRIFKLVPEWDKCVIVLGVYVAKY
jgi:hypothetical protein